MSTSETITRTDLTNILNEVLPTTSKVEYEAPITVSSATLISGYTATANGLFVFQLGKSTSTTTGYYYVKDTTLNTDVLRLSWSVSNGTWLANTAPMIKGHTYQLTTQSEVSTSSALAIPFANPVATSRDRFHISTSDPTSEDGENGDIWFKYSV